MSKTTSPIIRRLPSDRVLQMVEITMPDGLQFSTANINASDEEIEAEAQKIHEFLATVPEEGFDCDDEDPDSDGYEWERRALLGVA